MDPYIIAAVIAYDSLKHMIQAMKNDESILGLCGETRISNKTSNWVTSIQVFEYYVSHHLGKSFESVFGSVTCLFSPQLIFRSPGLLFHVQDTIQKRDVRTMEDSITG